MLSMPWKETKETNEMNEERYTYPLAHALAHCTLVFLVIGLLSPASANAGGLYVNEFSTSSQSNAGAGRGAWVPDASATLHNPAAMTRLDDHGFAGGFSLAVGDIRFDPAASSPNGTVNGGNQSGVAPIASFSYAHKVSDRVRFGLSFFSISGSVLDPGNDWAGRFELTELSLLTISVTPTLAVRLTDWLSVGGGPVGTYGVLNWKLRAAFPPGSESKAKIDKADDFQPSGRVGFLLHPRDDLALSVFYNSKTDFSLEGSFHGPIGLTTDLDLDLPLAQFVEVNAYWQATEDLALLAIFNWEDWSVTDDLRLVLGSTTANATTGFKDTYKVGVGANYRLSDQWLLQTGVTYDSSALRNKDRITALPVDEQIRFALGAQHDLSESLTMGLSFVYLNLGQGEVRTATVQGDYKRNDVFVIGLNLAYKSLPWSGRLSFPGAGR